MGALGPRFPQSQRPVPGDEGRLAASQELSPAAGVRFALHSVRETVLPACGVCPFTATAMGVVTATVLWPWRWGPRRASGPRRQSPRASAAVRSGDGHVEDKETQSDSTLRPAAHMSEGGEGGALSVTAAPWQAGWEWGRENRPLEGFVSHDPRERLLKGGPGPITASRNRPPVPARRPAVWHVVPHLTA